MVIFHNYVKLPEGSFAFYQGRNPGPILSGNQTWQLEIPELNEGFHGKIMYTSGVFSVAIFDHWRVTGISIMKNETAEIVIIIFGGFQ